MKPDFFWNSWERPYKQLYQLLLLIFLCSIVAYVIAYLNGSSLIIGWEVESMVDPVRTFFDSYRSGLYEYPIMIDNYVISQSFFASELRVLTWPAYILAVWFGIFISIIMALATRLSRFWFVVSVIMLTGMFVGLKLDYLVLFQSYEKIGVAVAICLFFPPLYIFHFVKREAGILIRIAAFMVASAIFALIIYFFSDVPLPFLHLVNYGIYVPLILTILFAFIIGHEILSGFLRVITAGTFTGDKNAIVHFLVISVIFLVNLVLLLLKNSRMVQIDLYVIGAFWLFTIAAVIGIWGYRAREVTYSSIFSFNPFGAFLFICLAITAHLTIAYFLVTGNDSFVEVAEDSIVYSQLGYSLIFVVYVLANFFDLIKNNLNVGKVLYEPRRMPYFISGFASVVVIMGLFFRFNMVPYYQAVAGYYSGIGDLYLQVEDYLSANEYYKISNIYSTTSHRANYALATLEKRQENYDKELRHLQQAVGKNPTEFAYVNLAARYDKEGRIFESIFTLQEGLEKFPTSGYLMNNLGLAYLQMQDVDSAFYNLNNSLADNGSENKAATNIYALLSREDLSIREDTLEYLLARSKYMPAVNNLLVLANDRNVTSNDTQKLQFGEPDDTEAAQLIYNYNKVLNAPSLVDSIFLDELKTYYDSSQTSWFEDQLKLAASLSLFKHGELGQAIEMLNLLAINSPEKEYFSILGKLSMLQGAYPLAVDHFKNAFQNGRPDVAPELALAYMENGELDKALFIWQQITQNADSSIAQQAINMINVIETKQLDEILYADTDIRFAFLNYRYREFDLEKLEGLVLTFESSDYRALGYLKLFNAYIELDQHDEAFRLLEEMGKLNVSSLDIVESIYLAQCQYAYETRDRNIMSQLHVNLESDNDYVSSFLDLFGNLLETTPASDSVRASNLKRLALRNPFFEPGVVEAVNFINERIKDPEMAYNILINSVNSNPFSIPLNKVYAMQCLRVGLNSYAFDTLEELRLTMNSVAFKTFEAEFQALAQNVESNLQDW